MKPRMVEVTIRFQSTMPLWMLREARSFALPLALAREFMLGKSLYELRPYRHSYYSNALPLKVMKARTVETPKKRKAKRLKLPAWMPEPKKRKRKGAK